MRWVPLPARGGIAEMFLAPQSLFQSDPRTLNSPDAKSVGLVDFPYERGVESCILPY
jgi:hypothetical protein